MFFNDTWFPTFTRERDDFGGLADLQRRIDRIFDEALAPTISRTSGETLSFAPSYDVTETEDHYVLSFDMPGVSKNNLKVEVKDNVLYVSGERKDSWKEGKNKNKERGRFYGRFETALAVPTGVDVSRVEASYQDGVLRVALPRAEASKPRQIQIDDGKGSFWSKLISHRESKEDQKTIDVKNEDRAA